MVHPIWNLPEFGALNSNFLAIPAGSNYHGSVVVDSRFPVDQNGVSIYEPVWRYLLNTSPLSLTAIQFSRFGQTVGRPAVGTTTKRFTLLVQGSGFDATAKVFINGTEVETELVGDNELRAKLPAGKLGSVGNSTVQVRNQNSQISNILGAVPDNYPKSSLTHCFN